MPRYDYVTVAVASVHATRSGREIKNNAQKSNLFQRLIFCGIAGVMVGVELTHSLFQELHIEFHEGRMVPITQQIKTSTNSDAPVIPK
ncbi:MAG TPA: hypothetical protein VL981_14115 [Candidatus Methylacidiphilales bacterium]|nr:hypothetical protein [Candidatus Methylacidiphilales bacterium]